MFVYYAKCVIIYFDVKAVFWAKEEEEKKNVW